MNIKKSLAPVIHQNSKVLILGSMPGEQSLLKQEYYGFRANHFWRLIASVLGVEEVPEDYPDKLEMLNKAGIALWDVISSCSREGSLDINIKNEEYNDICGFLNHSAAGKEEPNIRAVFFNGTKAAQSFKKGFGFDMLDDCGIDYHILPSSSPANTIGFEKKLEKWDIINRYI